MFVFPAYLFLFRVLVDLLLQLNALLVGFSKLDVDMQSLDIDGLDGVRLPDAYERERKIDSSPHFYKPERAWWWG